MTKATAPNPRLSNAIGQFSIPKTVHLIYLQSGSPHCTNEMYWWVLPTYLHNASLPLHLLFHYNIKIAPLKIAAVLYNHAETMTSPPTASKSVTRLYFNANTVSIPHASSMDIHGPHA